MAVKSYRDLIAWQKAMDLAEAVYQASRRFPKEEIYGLRAQLRAAASSVPSNIAEGQGRKSTNEFRHFLSIAYGSLCECQTQLLLARRFGYVTDDCCERVLSISDEVGRLLNGLHDSLPR